MSATQKKSTRTIMLIVGFSILVVALIMVRQSRNDLPPALTDESSSGTTTKTAVAPGGYAGTIETQAGNQRTYQIYIPQGYDPDERYPAVFALHGGGGNSELLIRNTGLGAFADEQQFILVAPNAYEQHWNDGRTYTFLRGTPPKPTDDVSFIHELQAQLANQYAIDTNQLFLTGMSNGSIMSQRIICEDPGQFSAVAAVSGPPVSLTPEDCVSSDVSVISINGTEDRFYPFQDGALPTLSERISSRIEQIPLEPEEVLNFWPTVHGCTEQTSTNLPPTVADGTTVTQYTFGACTSDAVVEHYVVTGMGHVWPPDYGRDTNSGNLITNAVIWDFFTTHRSR